MRYKITYIACLIQIIFTITAQAQVFTIIGDKAFGTSSFDWCPIGYYCGDGTFLLAGWSLGAANGDKSEPKCDSMNTGSSDIWLLKMDTAFNVLWDKSYGGNKSEIRPELIQLQNKWILTCPSGSDSSCEKSINNKGVEEDYWISYIDTAGNKNNDYSWGGSNTDECPQTIRLGSGNLVTCGMSRSHISGDKTDSNYVNSSGNISDDYWVVKSDSAGNKLWDKVYGGTGNEKALTSSFLKDFRILGVENDNFILAGTTHSPLSGNISDSCRGGDCTLSDIWIIKIDSTGNKIWDKRYGGSGADDCGAIINTDDHGFILCGVTDSPQGYDVSDTSKGYGDVWVIKLDSLGNKQWDRRYGGNKSDQGTWIEKAPDGGYLISGTTNSDSSGDVSEPKYSTIGDYWIFKIDENGNKIWDKRFGGPAGSLGSMFVAMPDSTIFLFGSSGNGTNAVKTDAGKGMMDYWIVHFKYICATSANINAVACDSYTSPSGNYNWTSSGIYNDTIPNATGCDSIITVNLTISNATASAQNITACDSYTSPSGSYNWTSSGIYNDTIQNVAGCDSVITINLTINTVDTSVTANAPFLSSNATGAVYQWMYCDSSLIAGATNQSYNATANGSYAVIVIQNGCEDTSSCYLVLNVGIDEKEKEGKLKVYPSPVKDVINITSASEKIKSVELMGLTGQTIYYQKVNNVNSMQLDLSKYAPGFYFMKISGADYSVVRKVIKE